MSSTSILSESQLNERLGRLLRQRKGPDAVMLGVLSVALFCGLVGFAVHFKWSGGVVVCCPHAEQGILVAHHSHAACPSCR